MSRKIHLFIVVIFSFTTLMGCVKTQYFANNMGAKEIYDKEILGQYDNGISIMTSNYTRKADSDSLKVKFNPLNGIDTLFVFQLEDDDTITFDYDINVKGNIKLYAVTNANEFIPISEKSKEKGTAELPLSKVSVRIAIACDDAKGSVVIRNIKHGDTTKLSLSQNMEDKLATISSLPMNTEK